LAHLVAQRAGDDHHVGLARRGAEQEAETLQIVAGGARVHHFDRAAGQAERHRVHGTRARPVDQLVGRGGDETFV
jgi:hypothetical protein